MKTYKVVFAGILAAIAAFGQTPRVENELLTKIREGNLSRVAALLRSGTDPNTRDDAGSTAVMHAAAFASVDMMRLLLEAGADPKTANASGSTPLMWATHDPARVRLLLWRCR
jgi:ankyrin repeat protein